MNLELTGRTVAVAATAPWADRLAALLVDEGATVVAVDGGTGSVPDGPLHALVVAPPAPRPNRGTAAGAGAGAGLAVDAWRTGVHAALAEVTVPLRTSLPGLEAAPGAVVVLVLGAAVEGTDPGARAAEDGLANLARSLSRELGPADVRVEVVVAPPEVDPVVAIAGLLSPRLGFMTGSALHLAGPTAGGAR